MKKFDGSVVRKIRESRGVSREQIAAGLGIGVASYGKKETGAAATSADDVLTIAEVLGCTVAELYGEEPIIKVVKNEEVEEMNRENRELQKLMISLFKKIEKLEKENLQLMKELAECRKQAYN